MNKRVPYVDFGPQTKLSKVGLTNAFERVLDSGKYVLGPEVNKFENDYFDKKFQLLFKSKNMNT